MWARSRTKAAAQTPQARSHASDARAGDVAAGGFLPADWEFLNGDVLLNQVVCEFDVEEEAVFDEFRTHGVVGLGWQNFEAALGVSDGELERHADEFAENKS